MKCGTNKARVKVRAVAPAGIRTPFQIVVTGALLLALTACSSVTVSPEAGVDPALLSGERAFGAPLELVVEEDSIVAMSDEMVVFMDELDVDRLLAAARFRRLFSGLARAGYFNTSYDAEKTFTAADTFEAKAGNCLSYTNMFVALARDAGLRAEYQVVDVPPSWDADSGYLIRYTHINVILKGVTMDKLGGQDITVDFNAVHPDPEYHRRVVSDRYATSLYHANLSVDYIRRGEAETGFAHLRRAIELEPENPDLWINLGAFYAKRGNYDAAIESYEAALAVDSRSKGAISGLARAYSNLGDEEMAAYYGDRVKRYRAKNAFYHFALAQAHYESADYERSLDAINTAIHLKGRQGRFYFMRGLAEQKLGDLEGARKSFARAERFGRYRDLKLRYVNELAGVSTPLG